MLKMPTNLLLLLSVLPGGGVGLYTFHFARDYLPPKWLILCRVGR